MKGLRQQPAQQACLIICEVRKKFMVRNQEAFDSFLNDLSARGEVSRPPMRLPFCVGQHVCLGHPGDALIVLVAHI